MGKAASGAGTIRQRKKDLWEARYYTGRFDKDGKPERKSVYGKNQAEVRKKLTEITSQLDKGLYVEPNKTTVEEWLTEWIESFIVDKRADTTVKQYRSNVKNNIVPIIGKRPIQSIRAADVQHVLNKASQRGLSAKTVKNISGIMHESFSKAVFFGLLQSNPCMGVEIPKAKEFVIKPLELSEMIALEEILPSDSYGNLFGFLMFSGLRKAEALGLTWDCVDFENRLITVNKQLSEDIRKETKNRFYIKDGTKTENGCRTFEPQPEAFEYLKRERQKQREARLKFGSWHVPEGFPPDLVFTNPDGRYINPDTAIKHFKRLAKQLGRPELRIHDLRHTYVTQTVAATGDYKTVSENVGHATPAFTMQRYQHVTREMQSRYAELAHEYYMKAKNQA